MAEADVWGREGTDLQASQEGPLSFADRYAMWSAHLVVLFDSLILIGVILRDSHGVAQVKLITGNKILRILKSKGATITWCEN